MISPKVVLVTIASWCILLQSSFAQQTDSRLIGIRSSASGRVVFSGVANNDVAAGAGGMLYGPGLIGAVATLALQGIFTSAAQNAQKTKLQIEADKVLLPYVDALEKFEYPDLMERSVKDLSSKIRIAKDGVRSDNEWMLDVIPSFRMTQDQSAFMVESIVSFYSPSNNVTEKPDHRSTVRVWSSPELGTDTTGLWAENDAERIKGLTANLTKQSIEIALNDWSQKEKMDQLEHTSVRFMQGKVQNIERAQILDQQCDRILMRTLRNQLVSAPLPSAISSEACTKPIELKDTKIVLPATASSPTTSN
jgi:hypothetical protein